MGEPVIYGKAQRFAIRVMRICEVLRFRNASPAVLSQVGRSATSISANLAEARSAVSEADFYNKLMIALKEARESENWLVILRGTLKLSEAEFQSIHADCEEVIRILVATTRTIYRKRMQKPTSPPSDAPPDA